MHGDFSRLTFDRRNHYSRVLVQQGRAYVDAEPNEQTAILLHAVRSLTRDIMGPHGVPALSDFAAGFRIELAPPAPGFNIGAGRYYVDGILVENDEADATYFKQPHFFADPAIALPDPCFVYLDVWERQVTFLDQALLRETALGGPDTSTRVQVVWQVKVLDPPAGAVLTTPLLPDEIATLIQGRKPSDLPQMRARVKPGDVSTTPCVMPPRGGYRGRENQLYRVEVHQGGPAGTATFKWSRDNGSIIFPVTGIASDSVTVEHLGLDATRTIVPGDWIELLDDIAVLHHGRGVLARVTGVSESRLVQLEPAAGGSLTTVASQERHPFLRRWDHRGAPPATGAAIVAESADPKKGWLDLEDGIQVQWNASGQNYVTGDYWTIVARAGTGQIEWPADATGPALVRPAGVEHNYAPLASLNGATVNRFRNHIEVKVNQEP